MKKLTTSRREFIISIVFLILLTLTACSAHKPINDQQGTMLAWVGDIPTDQGQWNQYQMEIEERQYQYQREEADRQAEAYREQVERCCPRPNGHYGHTGEPLDLGY